MSISGQLYQLQVLDLELASKEQTSNRIISQLGESDVVAAARNKLDIERRNLEELTSRQHSVEWEIDDLNPKLAKVVEELYSGRIRNPKELSDLQHEADILKTNRTQLEEKTLEIMEQAEQATKNMMTSDGELNRLEAEWQSQQQQLSTDLEQLKGEIAALEQERQLLVVEIDPEAIEIYQELKKQRRTAVARVEQGLCQGCRISLPVRELQQVRTDRMVRCGSCSRILYLA